MSERALVIVPTYNERENVRRLVDLVLVQDARIDMLIVDDGSPDGTGAVVDEIVATNDRVHVLHRPRKLGLGTAYIAGFSWALERDYAYVMEMDADFSHDPIHLPQFLSAVEGADLVLGSRYQQGRVTVEEIDAYRSNVVSLQTAIRRHTEKLQRIIDQAARVGKKPVPAVFNAFRADIESLQKRGTHYSLEMSDFAKSTLSARPHG